MRQVISDSVRHVRSSIDELYEHSGDFDVSHPERDRDYTGTSCFGALFRLRVTEKKHKNIANNHSSPPSTAPAQREPGRDRNGRVWHLSNAAGECAWQRPTVSFHTRKAVRDMHEVIAFEV